MSSEETLSPEAADLFGVVARRYSEGLTEEELREVRKRLEGVAER